MTYEQFIAGVHAFLAVVGTYTAVTTVKNKKKIEQIRISINGRLNTLFKDVEDLKGRKRVGD